MCDAMLCVGETVLYNPIIQLLSPHSATETSQYRCQHMADTGSRVPLPWCEEGAGRGRVCLRSVSIIIIIVTHHFPSLHHSCGITALYPDTRSLPQHPVSTHWTPCTSWGRMLTSWIGSLTQQSAITVTRSV